MPDDDLTKTLLSEYEATADALQHGVNVGVETMNKYHGMTGKLLAHTVRNLWSQQELDDELMGDLSCLNTEQQRRMLRSCRGGLKTRARATICTSRR